MNVVCKEKDYECIRSKHCECNDNRDKGILCKPSCPNCMYSDCGCDCCRRRITITYGSIAVGIVILIITYFLATHPLPDFRKWHHYFSNLLGTRKFRFIPRSELDAPKITHITEEMDINPYSFFPSKDLM